LDTNIPNTEMFLEHCKLYTAALQKNQQKKHFLAKSCFQKRVEMYI